MAALIRTLTYFLLSTTFAFLAGGWFSVLAQDVQAETQDPSRVINALGDDYQNSIVLLRNRFRIDYQVDEVTLVFFREYGSPPVVLVRPDGSKIYSSQADGENVVWFDDGTYDMVKIKKPVPGPWQAVGQVLPDSRVMVLSDIELHAEALPPVIFSGEILKQTAYLTNGGKPIDYAQFRDVVTLSIQLKSTNNPNYQNFGAQDEVIATFEDDGRGMDEAPLDGVFTGQFNLAIPPGEWRPVFRVETPMFSREQVDPVLTLFPNPVSLTVVPDDGKIGYHELNIDVVRDQIDIHSLLIDGKVRFPNGDIQNFSLTEPSDAVRTHRILAYEEGIFRVKVTAYATTFDGRDIILDVPEFSFLGETFEEDAVDDANGVAEAETVESASMQNDAPLPLKADTPAAMDQGTLVIAIITVNGMIIIIGVFAALFILWRRKQSALPSKSDTASAAKEDNAGAEKNGVVQRVLGLFKKKPRKDE
ncbi:TIGR03503 family protein [Alteromonas sp. C1M14]|uniref:TIGR03503 family protein n=1 Tax=Alteromonas sp. C1M14 TaxID=2841567 RepID=UPI00339D8609